MRLWAASTLQICVLSLWTVGTLLLKEAQVHVRIRSPSWRVGRNHTSLRLHASRPYEQEAKPPPKMYSDAADFYIYNRPPPRGFPAWLAAAQQHCCTLERYDTIETDLVPFRAANISAAMVAAAAQLPDTALFRVRGGVVSCAHAEASPVADTYLRVLAGIAGALPDMDFVVNLLDEPRVMRGEGSALDRAPTACAGLSGNALADLQLHGYFLAGRQNLTSELLPVFSQSKVPSCFLDITVPTWTNVDVAPVSADEVFGWKKRRPRLFFRGSSTGGHVREGTPFERMHRHRLVDFANARNGSGLYDVGFVEYLQCAPEQCAEMRARYGSMARVAEDEAWLHKYVMVMDGNTFSSRLMQTLTSGSLVFRAGMFIEWFDERIQPWVHYIPVRLDLSDLEANLAWAMGHDRQAQAIAEQAALQARLFIGLKDMRCYWHRLLLEYAALLQP